MLEAKGKVSLDGSGFSKTLGGLGTQVTGLSGKMKAQLGGAFIAAFGASAIKNFGKELLEQAQTIDGLAQKFSLTTTQVQQLQDEAKRTGKPFEELVKNSDELEATLTRLAGAPVLFSSENLDTLRAINEASDEFNKSLKEQILNRSALNILTLGMFGSSGKELDPGRTAKQEEFLAKEAADKRKIVELAKDQTAAEKIMVEVAAIQERARMKALSDEERAVELTKEKRRLLNFVEDPRNSAKLTQTDLATKEKRIAEINLELAKEPKKDETKPTTSQPVSFGLNQFQQIGGFAGQNPLLSLSQKQLVQLGIIARNTQPQKAENGFF